VSRRRDAALTLAVLVPVVSAAATLGAPIDPLTVGIGAGGALLFEAALCRRRAAVRRAWRRRDVQVGATTLALGGGAVGTLTVGTRALTALAAGLVAYLGLLAVVTVRDRESLAGVVTPPRLRRQTTAAVGVSLVATGVAAGALATAAGSAAAVRWALVAAAALCVQFVVLGRNLGANRASTAASPRSGLGAANLATLARGTLVAWLAGFVVVPWAGTGLAWTPVALYGANAALDAVDGPVARRVGRVTVLGARLDGDVDGLGVLAGVSVAVAGGVLPAPLLVVGLVKYGYVAAAALRRRRGGSLPSLPDRGSRRLLAVCQMLVIIVVLAPPVTATVATLLAAGVGGAYLLGFVRDWRLRVRRRRADQHV
jgi:CDP-diacylglycerol--glycerol-3-phosphate 3-phosphatidyltransferase